MALYAARPGADPELVWRVLTTDQRKRYLLAAQAAVIEYVEAVGDSDG